MALRPVLVDSRVMVGQLLTTARDHHLQALVVTANKPDTEALHMAARPAPTAAQETTTTTNITSLVGLQHTKTNTEASSTLHRRAMQVVMVARKVTIHPSLAGSRCYVMVSG
jgi:hypothetical protein